MYTVPDVVSGTKMSMCPWCDDEMTCDDNDVIKLQTFLSSLREKADTRKSKMHNVCTYVIICGLPMQLIKLPSIHYMSSEK